MDCFGFSQIICASTNRSAPASLIAPFAAATSLWTDGGCHGKSRKFADNYPPLLHNLNQGQALPASQEAGRASAGCPTAGGKSLWQRILQITPLFRGFCSDTPTVSLCAAGFYAQIRGGRGVPPETCNLFLGDRGHPTGGGSQSIPAATPGRRPAAPPPPQSLPARPA